jgi:diaminopimelate epimerase
MGDNGDMRLKFTKMHGAGNDFVVIDGIRQRVALRPAQWRWLADRHFGVGADQLLLVESTTTPGIDFRYRIFNADGGEVEHCGNGARCFVRFVRDQGLTDRQTVRVETLNGVLELRLEADGRVTVDMGAPIVEPARVPFDPTDLAARVCGLDTLYTLPLPGHSCEVSVLSMGNPHAVQVVADVDTAAVLTAGPLIECHPAFPRRVNAGFMQILARDRIALRVYERGAGETLACGTGACAAVVAGIRRGLLDARVDVHTRGGILTIGWPADSPSAPVLMTGPAQSVFEGEIEIPAVPVAAAALAGESA